jgi:hypothetical protein
MPLEEGESEMNYPVFKRGSMAFDMENYWAVNTDVLVFGSAQHLQAFSKLLTTGRRPKTIVAQPGRGMDVLVLPPVREARKDFIVMHERLVYQPGRFNMELIIGGSRRGLSVLAKYFDHQAKQPDGDLDAHTHVDDSEELLVLPAVFLNIRGPLSDVEDRLAEIAPPDARDLPPGVGPLTPDLWPYVLPTYKDLHGRLPIKRRRRR